MTTLREAAQAVVDAWASYQVGPIDAAMAALRAALAATPAPSAGGPGMNESSKGYVLALRDHDECCGTLRNHAATPAQPEPDGEVSRG